MRCVAPRARTFSITASTSARPTPSRRRSGDVEVPDPGDVLLEPGRDEADRLAVLLGEEEPVRVERAFDLGLVRLPARVRPGRRGRALGLPELPEPLNGLEVASVPWRIVMRAGVREAGEEVVGAQVLEWVEAGRESTNVGHVTIERGHRLPQSQVAGGPGVRPREVAGEEPVRRPLAEPAERDEPGGHLLVGQRCESSRSRSLRARPTTYSALRVEKPTPISSSSLACATRSRSGRRTRARPARRSAR